MIIVGAGMAGLIAANYFRKSSPTVIERQLQLPHNHRALLRFGTEKIGKTVGIKFRKVFVRKSVVHGDQFVDKPNPYICNQYSLKVTGKILGRSVWNLDPDYRYIAPTDFVTQLARGTKIKCNQTFDFPFDDREFNEPIISTIPMHIMMKMVGWRQIPEFSYRPIWAINFEITRPEVDVYQTIYFCDQDKPYYRASIVGKQCTIELIEDIGLDGVTQICEEVISFFGIPIDSTVNFPTYKKQEYGKIVPIEEDIRKDFMYTLTAEHNIYSLGRFATWRQIVLDDLIHDLDVINNLIGAEHKRRMYNQALTASHQKDQTIIPSKEVPDASDASST